MRLEWLEDILAVAETGSFTEAAERRHLTQSAFSRRIATIEESLSVVLFDRTRKPATLTPAAFEQTDKIAQSAQALRQLILDLRLGESRSARRLGLACQHSIAVAWAPAAIETLLARDPEIHFGLQTGNLDECLGMLLGRKADLALVYRAPGEALPVDAANLQTRDVGTDRLIPVLAGGRAGEVAGQIAAGELAVIAYPQGVFFARLLARHVLPRLPAELALRPRAETALSLAALELAERGLGVAWVPASLARRASATGGVEDLSASLPGCDLVITAVRIAGKASATAEAVWRGLGDPA